ncbi:MAG TPA: hypothetical protein VHZ03_54280 [Trebonia sp.]|nr:hypothetical protein [Trebonia sp.]
MTVGWIVARAAPAIHRYMQRCLPTSIVFAGSDWLASRVTQAANPVGESTSSDGSSPKPSSCCPGPHSAWASSQAACKRVVGEISSGTQRR